MTITTEQLIWALAIAVVLGGSLAYLFWRERRRVKGALQRRRQAANGGNSGSGGDGGAFVPVQLQLQAYERLILFTERIALPNLIGRLKRDGLNARDMQGILTETIRQEFEHNITQQIYVTTEAWDAVRNLKEQNIFIVNQVSSFLPPQATALDLSKHLLEMIAQNPKASLHGVVSEVLSYEAKKLMK
ncbi:MAG TPA: hypothetical protein VD993_10490 [Chitinophagaceae bacterium]|nr:hypothetical protein [Chitinophagaceae bacterium]